MTQIAIEKNYLGRNITITGHADGGGAEGKLVCAAVSMLAQTLANYLLDAEDSGRADIIDITLKSGDARISYITDEDDINEGADAICSGFALLCDSYPERVCLSEK